MVLADSEHVESELVGQLRLFQQLAHPLLGRHTGRQVGEGRASPSSIPRIIADSCLLN